MNDPSAPEATLFLPICWANLDPQGIPSPHKLDVLISNSEAHHLPNGPLLALQMIRLIRNTPQRALDDLWPRAWPWMYFLDTYRDVFETSPAYQNLYAIIFGYVDRIPATLPGTLPAFRILAAKAWMEFISRGDPSARGFRYVLNFVESDCTTLSDAHVAEYATGAGGPSQLAAGVYKHLTMNGDLTYLRPALRFARAVESARAAPVDPNPSVFHRTLRRRGIVELMTKIAWELTRDLLDGSAEEISPEVLTDCLSLLDLEVCNSSGYLLIPQALRAGLLNVILHLPTVCASDDHLVHLSRLLQKSTESTLYYSVLQELEPVLLDAAEQTLKSTSSLLFLPLANFISLATERARSKSIFDSGRVAARACNHIEVNSELRRTVASF